MASLSLVITDHADAGIVERSKGWGIPLIAIERSQFDSKQAFEQLNWMLLSRIVLMVLCWQATCVLPGAGLIARYEHKILNIHPALLPSFPGLHGHQQAIDAGVKVTGCTVHFVDAGMDTGLSSCKIRFLYIQMIQRILCPNDYCP